MGAHGFFRGQDDYDFAAEGDHGKLGYVSPAKNLIIVRNRLESGYDWSWSDRIKMTYDAVNSVDSARDF